MVVTNPGTNTPIIAQLQIQTSQLFSHWATGTYLGSIFGGAWQYLWLSLVVLMVELGIMWYLLLILVVSMDGICSTSNWVRQYLWLSLAVSLLELGSIQKLWLIFAVFTIEVGSIFGWAWQYLPSHSCSSQLWRSRKQGREFHRSGEHNSTGGRRGSWYCSM